MTQKSRSVERMKTCHPHGRGITNVVSPRRRDQMIPGELIEVTANPLS